MNACFTACVAIAIVACDRGSSSERVVVPIVSVDAAPLTITRANPIAEPEECRGRDLRDPIAAAVLPRVAAGFCVDGAMTKSYGEHASFTMNESCTTLFDGECEYYKRLRAVRVVSTRYVSGDESFAVHVVFTTFADAKGASDMFTLRRGPQDTELAPGVLLGSGVARVVRGEYLVELSFFTETSMSKADMERMNRDTTGAIALAIADRLRAVP